MNILRFRYPSIIAEENEKSIWQINEKINVMYKTYKKTEKNLFKM